MSKRYYETAFSLNGQRIQPTNKRLSQDYYPRSFQYRGGYRVSDTKPSITAIFPFISPVLTGFH